MRRISVSGWRPVQRYSEPGILKVTVMVWAGGWNITEEVVRFGT